MENPDPKFPRTAKAFQAYGPSIYAQARNTGISYTTLRDWLIYGKAPANMVKLACLREPFLAFLDDVEARRDELCPDKPTDQAA